MNKYKLEELNKSLRENNPITILDGITDYDQYLKAQKKVLWILKETNQNGKPYADDMRDFHRNITGYSKWKRTYKVIIMSTYSILNNCLINNLPPIQEIHSIMKEIAFINVKKTGGTSKSSGITLEKAYQKNKEILHEQIKLIDPDIIINASRVWKLFQDLPGGDWQSIENFNVKKNGAQVIIHTYHPNQKKIKHKKYIELIKKCTELSI